MDNLKNDKRKIRFVQFPNDDIYQVGTGEVTRILPYEEKGQMSMVPWLAIYEGENIVARVNVALVETIGYKE